MAAGAAAADQGLDGFHAEDEAELNALLADGAATEGETPSLAGVIMASRREAQTILEPGLAPGSTPPRTATPEVAGEQEGSPLGAAASLPAPPKAPCQQHPFQLDKDSKIDGTDGEIEEGAGDRSTSKHAGSSASAEDVAPLPPKKVDEPGSEPSSAPTVLSTAARKKRAKQAGVEYKPSKKKKKRCSESATTRH